MTVGATPEHERMRDDPDAWRKWGPYLAERAWGTVREDYSADGDAWASFPFDQARSRAYRWNEDGMAGVCDARQRLCLGLALWNGRDPILKERMFGLAGGEGVHGEDVKEYWWFDDAVPSSAWLRWRYAYPLDGYPYRQLVDENAGRKAARDTGDRGPDGSGVGEYELLDTGVFDAEPDGLVDAAGASARWADVTVTYAKAGPDDLVMHVEVENMSAHPARVHVLPTLWFRNTWSWGTDRPRPRITVEDGVLVARHASLATMLLSASAGPDGAVPRPLFCENETNRALLYGQPNEVAFPKDGIGDHVVHGAPTVDPTLSGTKAAFHYVLDLPGRGRAELVLRLTAVDDPAAAPAPDTGEAARDVLAARSAEADAWHVAQLPAAATADEALVHRQAVAGLLWSKQFYFYDVDVWLDGDPGQPPPPTARRGGRNSGWRHLNNWDVLSMPDTWEYPWYAAWDMAFHAVAMAHVDPPFAKEQIELLLREWYQHPNGQLPAYEWAFGDVNPPVHAWAALKVFELDGGSDFAFLARVLHKLLLNFTWWVNRKDVEGNDLFEGGFLGMDNVGPIDRSNAVPAGAVLEQSDATSWMAMYCLDLLEMSLRLAGHDRSYEPLATKFLEHFAYVATAMRDSGLWDGEDGFFYDLLTATDEVTGERSVQQLRVQSMVGLVPLFACRAATVEQLAATPDFADHLRWFMTHKPRYAAVVGGDESSRGVAGRDGARLLSLVPVEHLNALLARVFDPDQFLAPTGVRSMSKVHRERPYVLDLGQGRTATVDYEPAESTSGMFGGNSNWRGPVWFCVNHLLVESLRRYADWAAPAEECETDLLHLGVELPAGSGRRVGLVEAADELTDRLVGTFLVGPDGVRPAMGAMWSRMPAPWRDRVLFFEYFDAETGAGLGASHQTGWTALVLDLIAGRAAARER
jgi:hypothetical protein